MLIEVESTEGLFGVSSIDPLLAVTSIGLFCAELSSTSVCANARLAKVSGIDSAAFMFASLPRLML